METNSDPPTTIIIMRRRIGRVPEYSTIYNIYVCGIPYTVLDNSIFNFVVEMFCGVCGGIFLPRGEIQEQTHQIVCIAWEMPSGKLSCVVLIVVEHLYNARNEY